MEKGEAGEPEKEAIPVQRDSESRVLIWGGDIGVGKVWRNRKDTKKVLENGSGCK